MITLLDCYNSFALGFALFFHFDVSSCGSPNGVYVATTTTNHSTYRIRWNCYFFRAERGIHKSSRIVRLPPDRTMQN